MVNVVSNSVVPKITVILGGSFGAGHYAMCGRAYGPRFLYAWPSARYAVMGGEQAARTLVGCPTRSEGKEGPRLTDEQRRELAAEVRETFEHQADPRYGAARLWVDALIDPARTREVLVRSLQVAALNPRRPPSSWGCFRPEPASPQTDRQGLRYPREGVNEASKRDAPPGARASRPHHVRHGFGPLRHSDRPVTAPWALVGSCRCGSRRKARCPACNVPLTLRDLQPGKRLRAGRPRSRGGRALRAARPPSNFILQTSPSSFKLPPSNFKLHGRSSTFRTPGDRASRNASAARVRGRESRISRLGRMRLPASRSRAGPKRPAARPQQGDFIHYHRSRIE